MHPGGRRRKYAAGRLGVGHQSCLFDAGPSGSCVCGNGKAGQGAHPCVNSAQCTCISYTLVCSVYTIPNKYQFTIGKVSQKQRRSSRTRPRGRFRCPPESSRQQLRQTPLPPRASEISPFSSACVSACRSSLNLFGISTKSPLGSAENFMEFFWNCRNSQRITGN